MKKEYEERQRKQKEKEEADKSNKKDKSDEKAKEGGEKKGDENEKPKSPSPNETVRPGGVEACTCPCQGFLVILRSQDLHLWGSHKQTLTCILRACSPGDRDTSQQRGRRTSRVRVAQVSLPISVLLSTFTAIFFSAHTRAQTA